MNIARSSIEKPLTTWLLILTCLLGGIWSFFSLGRLEDPAFTIKTAVIVTQYPGASAEQVAREVSEPLESAIQKIAEVDGIVSINTPGQSLIEVEMKPSIKNNELPGIWTLLRARVSDATSSLPQGVLPPYVNDSFGDVFGLYFAVMAEGFDDSEVHELATYLRRELLSVPGVADVDLSGLPEEAIYVEPDLALLYNQNIPPLAIVGAIAQSNAMVPAGEINDVRVQAPYGSDSVSDIASLSLGVGGQVISLADIASVTRSRVNDPSLMIRYNGAEAFTLGVAGLQTENIVEVGKRVEQQLTELEASLPYGVEVQPIYQQHKVVETASNDFLVNLAMSVAIVVVVLALFMGWRAAVVVGSTLLLTVVGTLLFMKLFSIEMERISLGALIIAMGMLVDNAIVVAEGMQTAMKRGRASREAAQESASKTQIPLLGATVIGIMAFAAIGLSPDATGEFLFSLFAVIGISLLLSWLLAITVTPLFGHYFFQQSLTDDDDAYDGPVFRGYGALLRMALSARWSVVAGLIVLTVVSFAGFTQVKQQFFPDSNTPLFFVNYKLPQGSDIHRTSSDLQQIEDWLIERDDVVSVTSFIGDGAARFMLTYPTQRPNPSYGHLIVRTQSTDDIAPLQQALEVYGQSQLVDGEFRTKRLLFGPGGGDPIQLRISGPDATTLRALGDEATARMQAASDKFVGMRTNWHEQELVIVPAYVKARGETAGLTRDEVAETLRFATDGVEAGVYRDNERQVPIIVRASSSDEFGLIDQMAYSESAQSMVPIGQVIDGFDYEIQDTLIHRRDRVPTLTVSADISRDATAASVHNAIRASVEAMALPSGYQIAWGGEYEDSGEAQQSLANQLPLALLIMIIISILLFNALRQPLIIWLLVPMSVNGVVIGLLGTGLPFSFTALLGLLSLSGMLIKNGIVLVEEIDLVRAEGLALKEAIVAASTSRLRPVVLAAATTILGMIPLLGDAFFVSMAVTIMAGLAFASVLTLIATPVFYYLFFIRDECPRNGREPRLKFSQSDNRPTNNAPHPQQC
jgi:multidrug efflux pump subunit AcrB